jgi:hypothetical protein
MIKNNTLVYIVRIINKGREFAMDISKLSNNPFDFFKNFDINKITVYDVIFLAVCLVGVWIVFKILGTIAKLVSIAALLFIIFLVFQKTQSGDFANLNIMGVVQKDVQMIFDFLKKFIGI